MSRDYSGFKRRRAVLRLKLGLAQRKDMMLGAVVFAAIVGAFVAGLLVACVSGCSPAQERVEANTAANAAIWVERGDKLCVVVGAVDGIAAKAICDAADGLAVAGLDGVSNLLGTLADKRTKPVDAGAADVPEAGYTQ